MSKVALRASTIRIFLKCELFESAFFINLESRLVWSLGPEVAFCRDIPSHERKIPIPGMKKPRAIPKVKNPESQGFRENPGNKNPEIKKILILKKSRIPGIKIPRLKKSRIPGICLGPITLQDVHPKLIDFQLISILIYLIKM